MPGELVLVIDDNLLNLKLVDYTLTYQGYVVITATDAQEALAVLESTPPQIILMDIQLPGMDGLKLTTQLKGNEKYKHIPIIAITAYAMKGDKEKALAAGCNAYISKPIDTRKLPELIASFLTNKKNN